jgi:hypothetical protein
MLIDDVSIVAALKEKERKKETRKRKGSCIEAISIDRRYR